MKKKQNELISVIIPTYNSSSYIVKSLKSVIEQSYSNIEIVIVDDNSSDQFELESTCVAFFKENKFYNYSLYLSKEKIYGSGARNKGVDMASGEYIAFLDSGDIFLDNKLYKQYENHKASENENVVIYSQLYRGITISKSSIQPSHSLDDSKHISEYIFSDGLIQTSTLFLKKELFQRVKFTEGLKRHQDYDLCLRLYAENVIFKMIKEPLVHWVLEPDFSVKLKGESYDFCLNWIYTYRKLCTNKGLILYTSKPLLSNAIHSSCIRRYFKDILYKFGFKFFILNMFSILKFTILKVI